MGVLLLLVLVPQPPVGPRNQITISSFSTGSISCFMVVGVGVVAVALVVLVMVVVRAGAGRGQARATPTQPPGQSGKGTQSEEEEAQSVMVVGVVVVPLLVMEEGQPLLLSPTVRDKGQKGEAVTKEKERRTQNVRGLQ